MSKRFAIMSSQKEKKEEIRKMSKAFTYLSDYTMRVTTPHFRENKQERGNMSYIKGIGFRQTLTGKQILQVIVKSTDKDFDTIRKWKDADSKDVIRAIQDGYIKTDSNQLDKPDKNIEPPKYDVVSEGESKNP